MLKFLSRRIFFILLVSLVIIFVIHLGMRMVANSDSNQPNYNLVLLSRSAWQETGRYLQNAASGSLGTVRTQAGLERVGTIIQDAYLKSAGLLATSLLLATVAGIWAGAFTALTRRKKLVMPLLTLTVLGISAPSFFAGLVLRQGELIYVRIFGYPLVSIAGFGWDWKHMLLPVLVLAARPLAYITRATFLAFNEIMEQDFIRTAFSKGLTRPRTVNVHAVKNIAVPLLTSVGISLRFSLSALPVVEFLFVWPGLGLKMLEAIDQRQTQLVVGLALALGLTFLFINLLLELTYRIVDPRVRESSELA